MKSTKNGTKAKLISTTNPSEFVQQFLNKDGTFYFEDGFVLFEIEDHHLSITWEFVTQERDLVTFENDRFKYIFEYTKSEPEVKEENKEVNHIKVMCDSVSRGENNKVIKEKEVDNEVKPGCFVTDGNDIYMIIVYAYDFDSPTYTLVNVKNGEEMNEAWDSIDEIMESYGLADNVFIGIQDEESEEFNADMEAFMDHMKYMVDMHYHEEE